MRNFRLTLAYDGSRYKGWQKQGNTPNTIQAKLEALLSRLLGQDVEVNGSGRTDAGAHARMQVASFRAETEISADELLRQMRTYLPEDIGALSLSEAAPRFHARLNCVGKTYVYRIWNSEEPNVFERKYLWMMPRKLDIEAMREAAKRICGKHDFKAFCSNKRMKKSTVRRVDEIKIERIGGEVRFSVSGDGFLYNMVRIIVGTLVEVGLGERDAESVSAAIDSLDRLQAGQTAPACGLILWEVRY
ncbi:MAG: tRNA pseudouridine(38-40) synthase TruA [Clostridiales bacterium]|nr:tRNA pseudouridine(38-40) synthase TruA [Clostridiales bacterium]